MGILSYVGRQYYGKYKDFTSNEYYGKWEQQNKMNQARAERDVMGSLFVGASILGLVLKYGFNVEGVADFAGALFAPAFLWGANWGKMEGMLATRKSKLEETVKE